MSSEFPTATRAELVNSIEALYRQFSARTPPIIEGCPCCIDTRNVDALLATPLRELGGDQLWRYITGAYLTVGGDRDFRYLMPRIFELAALHPYEVPDTEIIVGKLARARWETWQAEETKAVFGFLNAWFSFALEQDVEQLKEGWVGDQTESLLCGIALAGMSLSDWLIRLAMPGKAPLLTEMRERHPRKLSPFWRDAPDGLKQVSAFLDEYAV